LLLSCWLTPAWMDSLLSSRLMDYLWMTPAPGWIGCKGRACGDGFTPSWPRRTMHQLQTSLVVPSGSSSCPCFETLAGPKLLQEGMARCLPPLLSRSGCSPCYLPLCVRAEVYSSARLEEGATWTCPTEPCKRSMFPHIDVL
jgi:hypothetical protein